MTQDKLNYLLVLAGEQNVTRAARRLYITQPTLTGFLNRALSLPPYWCASC